MFKKIVNFFFTEEEEYIHEEELNSKDTSDQLHVHPIKPFVNEKKEEASIKPVIKEASEPVVEIKKPEVKVEQAPKPVQSQTDKKTKMINVDDPISSVREVTLKRDYVKPITPPKYQPTEIISPIYGGPKPSEKVNPVSAIRQDAVKKTVTSSVISPMYGAISVDATPDEETVDMNLDISDLLSPERNNEEVQTSLYDYLEDISHD